MSASDPELLKSFYQRLFPWRYLFQWLNHSPTPTPDFENREFAFTLPNDAMLRYMSYRTSDLLRKDVLRLMPTRIEIGPAYTTNPRERKMLQNTAGFRPLSKELCFDIDLTDYDDIRTCCDKANICNKCWRFMVMAVKVIEAVLRDDFGFKHIMWVYSGRRGIHAWVSDKSARTMDDSKRKVIAGYLEVIIGGAQSGKRVNLRRPLHPHLSYVPLPTSSLFMNVSNRLPTAEASTSSNPTSKTTSSRPKTPGKPRPAPRSSSSSSPTKTSATPSARNGTPPPAAPPSPSGPTSTPSPRPRPPNPSTRAPSSTPSRTLCSSTRTRGWTST